MCKHSKFVSRIFLLIGVVSLPLQGQNSKIQEPGELKLRLQAFPGKKSHTLQIKLDWGNGKLLGDNTSIARVKGEATDSLGRFNYVVTRIANPEWTEFNLWINYGSGEYKNQSLRLSWVTHGHEPPENSSVADGVWTFGAKLGRVSGTSN